MLHLLVKTDILIIRLGFWLPILARTVAKVTGVTDYNIVQNNGICLPLLLIHLFLIPSYSNTDLQEHVPRK